MGEEKIVIKPAVLPEKEAEAEVEDLLKPKAKVRDESAEREKSKPEEEKIIIKPAVLPEKAKEEPDDDAKTLAGRKKVSDEFPDKTKQEKPDEKIVIRPKKIARVRFSDQPGVVRRKPRETPPVDEPSKDDMFKDVPVIEKKKVSDEFPDREKKAKEEEKIIITPAVLPKKAEGEEVEPEDARKPRDKVRDEFAERKRVKPEEEKIIITPAVLTQKEPEEPEDTADSKKPRDKVRDEFAERQRIKPEPKKKLS